MRRLTSRPQCARKTMRPRTTQHPVHGTRAYQLWIVNTAVLYLHCIYLYLRPLVSGYMCFATHTPRSRLAI